MYHYLELHQGFSIDFINKCLEGEDPVEYFVLYEDEIQKPDEDNFATLSVTKGSAYCTEPEFIMLLIDMMREEWSKQKYKLFINKEDRQFNVHEYVYEERDFTQERDKRWADYVEKE